MYEKYWESDEECDGNELSDIMRDEFIVNLKKGAQMPLVLPAKDEHQFKKLITKKALKHDHDSMEPSIKTELMEISSEVIANGHEPSLVKSSAETNKELQSGSIIKNIINDTSSPLMLFQLPSSLAALSAADQSKPVCNGDSSTSQAEVGSSRKQHQSNTYSAAVDFQGRAKHCLTGLPTSVEIGKLQLLRSGRAVMNIGGHVMDVTEAIPSRCFETAVYIETHDEKPVAGPSTAAPLNTRVSLSTAGSGLFSSRTNGLFPAPISAATATPTTRETFRTKNTISVLGEIPHAFVCSYDLRSSRKNRCSSIQTPSISKNHKS